MKKNLLKLITTILSTLFLVACGDDSFSGSFFPKDVRGHYANHTGYNEEYVTINKSSIIYHTLDKDYTFSSKKYDFEQDMIDMYHIYDGDTKVAEFYFLSGEEYSSISLCIYVLDGVELQNPVYESFLRASVLNYVPLDNYVDLDNEGPWGTIPHTDEIESFLLDGFTDDYIIEYDSEDRVSGISHIYTSADDTQEDILDSEFGPYDCQTYIATSYNKEGKPYRETHTLYILSNATDAEKVYLYQSAHNKVGYEYTLKDNLVMETYDAGSDYDDGDFSGSITKIESLDNKPIACDKHCVARLSEILYLSKPLTKEVCQELVDLDRLMTTMRCDSLTSSDNLCEISIFGDTYSPTLRIRLAQDDLSSVYATTATADDDTLIFCSSGYGEAIIAELKLKNQQLVGTIRYYDTDSLSLDNYKDYKPFLKYSFEAPFTHLDY